MLPQTGEVVGVGTLGFGEGKNSLLRRVPLAGFGRLENGVDRLELSIAHGGFGALLLNSLGDSVEPFRVLGGDCGLEGGKDVAIGGGKLRGAAARQYEDQQRHSAC